MPSPTAAVETYVLAKDGNRPFLMRRVFHEDVDLEIVVNTSAIDFPGVAEGMRAIEDLSRRFANDFENVFTFCLAQPSADHRRHFPCAWLVGMSAKGDGPIRVGSGRYDWYFTPDERCLVERLLIRIDVMEIIPAAEIGAVMGWLAQLPYPWCSPAEALATMPELPALQAIRDYVSAVGAE